ncbi:hypothetical protein V1503_02840 [Bacillus sp. SCS-151]
MSCAYVTNVISTNVSVIDTKTHSVITIVSLNGSPEY